MFDKAIFMDVIPITISAADGRDLSAHYFVNAAGIKPRAWVIINSAAGVRQTFHADFARYLAQNNYAVLTWDARGIGASAQQSVRHDQARMRDWGQQDLQAVLLYCAEYFSGGLSKLHVIGHSAGGNLAGLAPALMHVGSLCLIASGCCYWRMYPRRYWLRMLTSWHVLLPMMTKVFGYLPARLGVGHDLPKQVAHDWRDWSLMPNYLFDDTTINSTCYSRYQGPLLALSIDDDQAFAPKAAVDALVGQFSAAQVERLHITPAQYHLHQIGHFAYFKSANAVLWPLATKWLGDQTQNSAPNVPTSSLSSLNFSLL